MSEPKYLFDVTRIKTFEDIPKFIGSSGSMWGAQYSWSNIGEWTGLDPKNKLELEPDFQRGHCWSMTQRREYIEYCLRGGKTGHDIYFNQMGSLHNVTHPYVCVDGLQRLTTIQMFMDDKLEVFGHNKCSDLIRNSKNKRFPIQTHCVYIHVNNLQSRADVLRWYLEMNAGGTPHSSEELTRVRKLLQKETAAKKIAHGK